MRTVWFVRHAESTANAAGLLAGHDDADLTERGVQQALELREELRALAPARILASDLTRAVRTAALAWPHRTPVVEQLPALRERDLGAWSTTPRASLSPARRRQLVSWTHAPPHGESNAALARRVLGRLAEEDDGASWLLFVHAGVIRVVVGLLDEVPLDEIGRQRIRNADRLERAVPRGQWRVLIERLKDR